MKERQRDGGRKGADYLSAHLLTVRVHSAVTEPSVLGRTPCTEKLPLALLTTAKESGMSLNASGYVGVFSGKGLRETGGHEADQANMSCLYSLILCVETLPVMWDEGKKDT